MSQVYRAHSPAQVIGEAGALRPSHSRGSAGRGRSGACSLYDAFAARWVRRKPWTTLAVIAFAALAGAVVFGGGGESRVAPLLRSMQPYQGRRRWWRQRLRGLPGRRPRPNASPRQT